MANSIDLRAIPGARSMHPIQERPSAPAAGQRVVPGARATHPIASTGAAPISAARVAPGSANPQIAADAARVAQVAQSAQPAAFCIGDRSRRAAPRQDQDPRQRAPTPPPHLTAEASKPLAFDPRAQEASLPKRSPSPS